MLRRWRKQTNKTSARAGVTAITGYLCRNTRVARFFVEKEMHMNYEKLSGSIRAVIDRRPGDNGAYLCMDGLKIICEKCGLELNLKKTRVIPLRDYYRWLKTRFIITPTGKVVRKMNKDSTKIVRHKLRAFRGKLDRGEMTLADIRCSVDSYNGHMKRGHSFKVRQRTNQYFKSLYGFYPDEKGWKSHV